MITGVLNQSVDRAQWWSLFVGLAATAISIAGALFDWSQFFHAYLFSYLFVLGLALGSLALVMIHRLTGGAWGFFVQRLAEAQMKTLPLLAVLFVPIAIGLPHIYIWADSSINRGDVSDSRWNNYLEPRFFLVRAAGYFVAWLVLMAMVSNWSRQQEESANARSLWRAYKASGPGLVLLGVTLHFAAIDWLMSLQPGFTSTIFGPLLFSSQLLSSFALSVMFFCWLSARPELERILSSKVMNDLGTLLFTLLVLWAYLAWFQFMLIWIADLPRGNIWYLIRWHGVWRWLVLYLVAIHFAVPFLLLLFRAVKQSRLRLGVVAAIIFAGQWLFMYYQVMPVFDASHLAQHWMDFITPLGLGGIWFACFLWLLTRRSLLPLHDLNYEQAVRLHELDLEEIARDEALAHV